MVLAKMILTWKLICTTAKTEDARQHQTQDISHAGHARREQRAQARRQFDQARQLHQQMKQRAQDGAVCQAHDIQIADLPHIRDAEQALAR